MSFFKEFKEDFSQAVNELMPGEDMLDSDSTLDDLSLDGEDDILVNTLDDSDLELELDSMPDPVEVETKPEPVVEKAPEPVQEVKKEEVKKVEEPKKEDIDFTNGAVKMSAGKNVDLDSIFGTDPTEVDDGEVSTITKGMKITGDLESSGSIDVCGVINGNVKANGKLVISTGKIKGNSTSTEFFADTARVDGEVVATGKVKIGQGSVIVGNITATSAVIAGAVKGDIDVKGPVIVDTTAVVMGNIKSQSVQINNGAVIEGFCSQCYADINMDELFSERFM